MSKRFIKLGRYVTCIFILIVLLSSCSLAKEELQDLKSGDKLIGVFVTLEEDLKDYGMQEGDTLYFDEKKLIRADGSVKYLSNEEFENYTNDSTMVEGEKQKDGTYKFGDIDGYYIGYTKDTVKGEDTTSMSCHCSDGVYDVYTTIDINSNYDENKMDDKDQTISNETVSIEATIGISSSKEAMMRINQVHQRKDGSVYTIIPSSDCLYIDKESGGASGALSISESYQSYITGTGISKQSPKITNNFKVNIEQVDFLENAFIRQMDKNHELISLTEVDLLKKNQEIQIDTKTDYVIIEEHFIDKNGASYNKRTAYDCAQIGEISEDGHEEFVSHDFHITKNNGKTDLITLSMQR